MLLVFKDVEDVEVIYQATNFAAVLSFDTSIEQQFPARRREIKLGSKM